MSGATSGGGEFSDRGPLPIEPALAEVDFLALHRNPNGSYPDWALRDVFDNLVSDMYEAVVPNGIMRIARQRTGDEYLWMGMTAEETARQGYDYYTKPFAHHRVGAEIAEAIDAEENLRPGWAKVTISPRAAGTADATFEDAKTEQLHDRDMVRIQYLRTDEWDQPKERVTESVQIFDVPLSAWVALLSDPHNIFERPISVEVENSALAVLKTHDQTYVPLSRLPEGPVTLLRQVLPYITDPTARDSVERQLADFATNQQELRKIVEQVAVERQHFLGQLDISLQNRLATPYVTATLDAHLNQFKGQHAVLVGVRRQADGSYYMDRALAALCSKINKATNGARAAVLVGNKDITQRLPAETAANIITEASLQNTRNLGWTERQQQMLATNQAIANSRVQIGGGCSPDTGALFDNAMGDVFKEGLDEAFGDDESYSFDKEMHCVVCQAPPRRNESKKMCGPCGICQECDTVLRANRRP